MSAVGRIKTERAAKELHPITITEPEVRLECRNEEKWKEEVMGVGVYSSEWVWTFDLSERVIRWMSLCLLFVHLTLREGWTNDHRGDERWNFFSLCTLSSFYREAACMDDIIQSNPSSLFYPVKPDRSSQYSTGLEDFLFSLDPVKCVGCTPPHGYMQGKAVYLWCVFVPLGRKMLCDERGQLWSFMRID